MTDEVVQIVEIVQPLCALDFGVSPCTATGVKCFNTRATCKDTSNYDGSATLSLYFTRGNVADRGIVPYAIPSLEGVSTAPTVINLAASNPDAQGLGQRAICNISFKDHPHNDFRVDPYQSERGYDATERGSFWSKWIVRNKYRQNIQIKVYEGYSGQTLSQMSSRTYFLQSVTGPDDSGRVTITGKDILARVEDRKAQAPKASPGELYANITSGATSFEVANAVEADYPASGTVRIGDELMTYTARATSANGVQFTGVVRGTDGTTAEAHEAEELVQECLRFTDEPAVDVIETLLTDYAGVDAAWLDTANWATEFDTYLFGYNLTTVITEPESVQKLLSEIQEQVGCFLWWDERAALVKFKAIRGTNEDATLITDETNILPGVSITEKPRERASQVWYFYRMRDFTGDVEDAQNYESLFVRADLESEGPDLYGEPSIRQIYSRWIRSAAYAETTTSKISTRYVDIPRQIRFRMDAKDRAIWTGDTVRLSHYLDVDEFGEKRIRNWTIISAEETDPGHVCEYVAEDTTLYGRVFTVHDEGDYAGVIGTGPYLAFIGDADGLLSDGTTGARVA